MDEQQIHAQFVNIALQLTPPLLRNRNVQNPEEAVSIYMQVYDAVIQAANQSQSQEAPSTSNS